MEKIVKYRLSKINFLLGLILLPLPLLSQITSADTLTFDQFISSGSIDRMGNLYLAFEDGSITQYNSKLDSLVSYNPTKTGEITLLEAWHGFQIFTFYEEYQEYKLLNRFLTQETRYHLPDIVKDYVNLCTFSANQNLWIFNESEFKLLKINTFTKEILLERPLEFLIAENESQIVFMKEFQNNLYLLSSESAIYIFDNLGNYLNKIEVPNVIDFSFKGSKLILLRQNSIDTIDLYKGIKKSISLPDGNYFQIELLGKNSILLLKENKGYLFSADL